MNNIYFLLEEMNLIYQNKNYYKNKEKNEILLLKKTI